MFSCLRCSTSSRAIRSSATAWKSSPAPGTSPMPVISTGTEGPAVVDLPALGVGHGADTAHGGAGDDDVALVQGAVLDQQGGHGAAALVQAGLDDSAVGGAVGVGLQLPHLGGQDDHFQQVVYAHAGLGGDGAA